MDILKTPSKGVAKDYDDKVIDATAGGVTLLAANQHRQSALITNVGAEPMRVTTDGSPPTPTHGKRVRAGESLILPSPHCPTAAVKAIREGLNNTTANASEIT